MDTPKEENLRKMSYSALRKHAKGKGINKQLKADDLISLLLEKAKNVDDSFVTLENEIMNSCKKNKSAKFDEDKQVESDTPRRETYTLDSPSVDVSAIDNDLIVSSASPVLRKTPPAVETSFNVTMSRGSERKKSKRKVSFVTPLRKSARLSSMTPRYASVKDRPKTPIPSRFSSGRKSSTSVKAKISFTETPSEKEVGNSGSKKSGGKKGRRVSTPMPSSKCKRMDLSSPGLNAPIATPEVSFSEPAKGNIREENIKMDVDKVGTPSALDVARTRVCTPKSDVKKPAKPVFQFSATPDLKKTTTPRSGFKTASPHVVNLKTMRTFTPKSNIKKAATPISTKSKSIRIVTPRSQMKKNATPLSVSSKDKRTPRSCVKSASTPSVLSESKVKVPNFKELHQKAFDKMESIDEYQQRKIVNSAKKLKEQNRYQTLAKSSTSNQKRVAPKKKGDKVFGGIPFIPSVTSTKDMKLDASTFASQFVANKKFTAASRKEKVAAKKVETQVEKKPVKSLSRENTPLKKRFRFDLQASLTKKLPYKPHKGPLKPLADQNLNTSVLQTAPTKPIVQNKVIEAKRVESRKVLRGVRVNRRFELQMQKRKLTSN